MLIIQENSEKSVDACCKMKRVEEPEKQSGGVTYIGMKDVFPGNVGAIPTNVWVRIAESAKASFWM